MSAGLSDGLNSSVDTILERMGCLTNLEGVLKERDERGQRVTGNPSVIRTRGGFVTHNALPTSQSELASANTHMTRSKRLVAADTVKVFRSHNLTARGASVLLIDTNGLDEVVTQQLASFRRPAGDLLASFTISVCSCNARSLYSQD